LDVVGLTSGDTVTVTGEYLIPICFAEDSITSTMHALNTFEVSDIKLREILEQELIDLT
jgi:spore coat protein CotF